jgi:hypothetical protein
VELGIGNRLIFMALALTFSSILELALPVPSFFCMCTCNDPTLPSHVTVTFYRTFLVVSPIFLVVCHELPIFCWVQSMVSIFNGRLRPFVVSTLFIRGNNFLLEISSK